MGAVDVTAQRDDAVLRHLSGAEEYLYVSGLAVSPSFRFNFAFIKIIFLLQILQEQTDWLVNNNDNNK